MKILKFVLGIPLLIGLVIWFLTVLTNPTSPQVSQQAGELIAQAAVPWWLPVIQFLVGIPGIVGGVLVVAFLIYLARNKGGFGD